MKLQSYKRLYKQDFPQSFQAVAEQLANTLNGALDTLYNLANNNISLQDNVLCEIKTFNIIADKNGNPTASVNVKMDTPGNVEGVTVLNVTNQTVSTGYPTSGVTVSYTLSNTGLQINNVTGLIAGNNYLIKLVIYQY